jgi:hypothetical protein
MNIKTIITFIVMFLAGLFLILAMYTHRWFWIIPAIIFFIISYRFSKDD